MSDLVVKRSQESMHRRARCYTLFQPGGRIITFRLLLSYAAVVLGALAFGASALPDPLAAKVSIYRDDFGVPHIVGETEEATFFGYSYTQAQDHLERMMLEYREAQGRRAEVQGFSALGDGYLHFIPYEYRWDGDYLARLSHTKKCVVENKGKIESSTYRILDAFARGVNQYIAEHRAEIPAWIDGITAEDVEALERSQYLRFYSVGDALLKLTGGAEAFPDFGSNQWAIAPSKSANGRIIHVEHLHMPWANRFKVRSPPAYSRQAGRGRRQLVRQPVVSCRLQRQNHVVCNVGTSRTSATFTKRSSTRKTARNISTEESGATFRSRTRHSGSVGREAWRPSRCRYITRTMVLSFEWTRSGTELTR